MELNFCGKCGVSVRKLVACPSCCQTLVEMQAAYEYGQQILADLDAELTMLLGYTEDLIKAHKAPLN